MDSSAQAPKTDRPLLGQPRDTEGGTASVGESRRRSASGAESRDSRGSRGRARAPSAGSGSEPSDSEEGSDSSSASRSSSDSSGRDSQSIGSTVDYLADEDGESDKPLVVRQLFDLKTLGVDKRLFKASRLTFESRKFICIREATDCAIIDTSKDFLLEKMSTTASGIMMHRSKAIIVLRAKQGPNSIIQAFNLETKTKLAEAEVPEHIRLWKWVTDSTLAIVGKYILYHLDINSQEGPQQILDLGPRLAACYKLLDYGYSPDPPYCFLVGKYKTQSGQKRHHCQLFAIQKKQQLQHEGWTACFAQAKVSRDPTRVSQLFCSCEKRDGQQKLVIMELGAGDAGRRPLRRSSVIELPDPDDYPAILKDCAQRSMLLIISKKGHVLLYEISQAAFIYRKQFTDLPCLAAVTTRENDEMMTIDAAGRIFSVELKTASLVSFVYNDHSIANNEELAVWLSHRCGLPGGEEISARLFQQKFRQREYEAAAELVQHCPGLQNHKTMQMFKKARATPALGQSPVVLYLTAVSERRKLDSVESMELVRHAVAQNKVDLIFQWIKSGKLTESEELEASVRKASPKLAVCLQQTSGDPEKVVQAFVCTEQFDKIIPYCMDKGHSLDIMKTLREVLPHNSRAALGFAKMVTQKEPANMEKIAYLFIEQNKIPECTALVLEAAQDREEEADLQTQLLLMNLKVDRRAAEKIFESKKLTHYDKEAVAKQCEQWGLFHHAFLDYSDRQDKTRVLLKTTRIHEDAVVEFFGGFEGEGDYDCLAAMQVLRELLFVNKSNEMVVASVADAHIDNLGLQECIDLLEEHECLRGLHFLLSRHYKTTQHPEIHFRYIEICVKLHAHDDLARFVKEEPVCYEVSKVKQYLEEANLPDQQPLMNFLDKHNYIDELEDLLQRQNLQAFAGSIDAGYKSESDKSIASDQEDSHSFEEQYAKKIELAEKERREVVMSHQSEDDNADTSRPLKEDGSFIDFACMVPEKLENAEMLAIENSEMEMYNLEVQLHDRPHMKPTENEIRRAAERGTTYQEQRQRIRSVVNKELDDEDDEVLSYKRLKQRLRESRPTKANGKAYGLCHRLGYFPCMRCCYHKLKRVIRSGDEYYQREMIDVSEMSESIGLGATLLLFTIKALAYLFLVLSIVSLPTLAIFHEYNDTLIEDVHTFFKKLTLGNIGQDNQACAYGSPKQQDAILIQCSFGDLVRFQSFGITAEESSTCTTDPKNDRFLDYECTDDLNLFQFKKKRTVQKYFEKHCVGKQKCEVPIKPYYTAKGKEELLSISCFDKMDIRIESGQQSVFAISAQCSSASVRFEQFQIELGDSRVGLLIVGIDILGIVCIVVFLKIIKLRQQEYITDFKQRRLRISDFTLTLYNLPTDQELMGEESAEKSAEKEREFNSKKEEVLKSQLWDHVRILMANDALENGQKKPETEEDADGKTPDGTPGSDPFEIVDICFGKTQHEDTQQLVSLYKCHKEIVRHQHYKISRFAPPAVKAKFNTRLQLALDRFNAEKKKYREFQEALAAYHSGADINPIQNTQIDQERSIQYAYVVFRSQADMDTVLKLYQNIGPCKRCCFRLPCAKCCCSKRKQLIDDMYFKGRWPDVQQACEPSEIYWDNLGYRGTNKVLRRIATWAIAFVILAVTIYAIVLMTAKAELLKSEINTEGICTGKTVSALEAYQDYTIRGDDQGLMNCFCSDLMRKDVQEGLFYRFTELNATDTKYYCRHVKFVQVEGMIVVFGTAFLIVAVNELILFILDKVSVIQRHHTEPEKHLDLMRMVIIVHFTNIALILLFVHLNAGPSSDGARGDEEGKDGGRGGTSVFAHDQFVLNGRHQDFSVEWYYSVGAILCITMLMNMLAALSLTNGLPIFKCCIRCYDRGCRLRLKKSNDEDDDAVNTRQYIQSDLERVYEDPVFKGYFVYAQVYTALLVCLMYSSGIPAMYGIGFLFFFVLYWVSKALVLKFFRRSTTFDEQLQLESLGYVKFAVVIHFAVGGVMYSNSRLFSEQQQRELQEYLLSTESFKLYVQILDLVTKQIPEIAARFQSLHAKIYFLAFLFFVAFYILRKCIFGKCEEKLAYLFCCRPCRAKNGKKEFQLTNEFLFLSDDFYKELEIPQLAALHKKSTRELAMYERTRQDTDEDSDLRDKGGAASQTVTDHLSQRVRSIEATIDTHLRWLLYSEQKKNTAYYKYRKYRAYQKLLLLQANSAKLLQKSETAQIMRMQSEIQSYDFHESKNYRIARRMKSILEQQAFNIYEEPQVKSKGKSVASGALQHQADGGRKKDKKNVIKKLNRNVFPAELD